MSTAASQINMTVTHEHLEALRGLEHDWDGSGAIPIDHAVLASASRFISDFGEWFSGPPQVVPMTKGRLQFEWHHGNRSLEIEFEDPQNVHYLKWDSDADFHEEDMLPTSAGGAIKSLLLWFSSEMRNADSAERRAASS